MKTAKLVLLVAAALAMLVAPVARSGRSVQKTTIQDITGPGPLADITGPGPLVADITGPGPLVADITGPGPLLADITGPGPLSLVSANS